MFASARLHSPPQRSIRVTILKCRIYSSWHGRPTAEQVLCIPIKDADWQLMIWQLHLRLFRAGGAKTPLPSAFSVPISPGSDVVTVLGWRGTWLSTNSLDAAKVLATVERECALPIHRHGTDSVCSGRLRPIASNPKIFRQCRR